MRGTFIPEAAAIALVLSACAQSGPAPLDCSRFKAERRAMFDRIDANKDGRIDRGEWAPVEKEAFAATAKIDQEYNSTSNPDDITRMFSEYDIDRDGSLGLREFRQGLCD